MNKTRLSKRLEAFLLGALFFFLLLFFALFLSDPKTYSESVSKGIGLWAVTVLPSTFPLLVVSSLLFSLPAYSALSKAFSPAAEKLFRVSGAGASAAILSALSGYPVGARLCLDLRNQNFVSKDEIFRLACLATTSGPPFLVGTVGAVMFQSVAAGFLLYFCHLAAVYLLSFFLRFTGKPSSAPPLAPKKIDLFETVLNAVRSVLCVGGFIALFYCLGDMLASLGLFQSPLEEGICRGLLEMTAGCSVLSKIPSPFTLSLCCALVTFGGGCVLLQEIAFLKPAGVKILPFLLVKFLQGLLSFAICYPLSLLLF